MKMTSEYVSVGHPDKTCDYIASYLLDRYIERDDMVRFAVEVQMKDNYVTLGGEITTRAKVTKAERAKWVAEAVRAVGYTGEYAKLWGSENVPNADALKVTEHISEQSPDIAQGVDADGWGDQGIFWGMAVANKKTGLMPLDHHLAKMIGLALYEKRVGGIDIKTQVEVENGRVNSVILAVPCFKRDLNDMTQDATELVRRIVGYKPKTLIINGTGAYVRHGSVGDCGTTGRKLAVDFYGGNCRIGGGSPWTKDATKADLTLNIYARQVAVDSLYRYGLETCYCAMSCCIGRNEISVTILDGRHNLVAEWTECHCPCDLIRKLGLRHPVYQQKCYRGIFG